MSKKKKPNEQMTSAIILAKLYRDGFFIVDEEKKTVEIDMRKSRIVAMYKKESYDDIKMIMNRTADGLDKAGYTVKKRYLDGTEENAVQAIKKVLADGSGDGFVSKDEDQND